ncbi:MAG: hypothetical protein AB7F89_11435 [Pirellulaceae bacterium]
MTPLHGLGQFIREMLSAVPLPAVRVLFLASLAVVAYWVIRLPRSAGRQQPDSPWTEDLRIWAFVAIAVQFVIYAVSPW